MASVVTDDGKQIEAMSATEITWTYEIHNVEINGANRVVYITLHISDLFTYQTTPL